MEERVPPDNGKDDPPPSPPPLDSPNSFKRYPLPRPPPPRRSNSNVAVHPKHPSRQLTKSQDSSSFTFPLPPPSDHQEIEPDKILNNATSRLFNVNPTPLVSPLPLPPGREPPETYVVQIPKDQIFRIPPPENARILESFRKPKSKKCPGSPCLWVLIALAIIGLIIGLAIWIIHLLYNPKSPNFSITDIQVIVPPPSKHQHKKPEFDVSLLVENPNQRLGIQYEKEGESSLSFKNHVIAKGDYPSSSQDTKTSMDVQVKLNGSSTELPHEIQNSLDGKTKSKTEISFRFAFNVTVKFTSWMQPKKKDLDVTCDFKVNSLGKNSKIIEQNCAS